MLSANEANESAWIVSPGKKVKQKESGFRAAINVLGQIFARNAKNDPITLCEASKSVKK